RARSTGVSPVSSPVIAGRRTTVSEPACPHAWTFPGRAGMSSCRYQSGLRTARLRLVVLDFMLRISNLRNIPLLPEEPQRLLRVMKHPRGRLGDERRGHRLAGP